MARETHLTVEALIYPMFVEDGLSKAEPILAMPGQSRWPVDLCHQPVIEAMEAGVPSFLLFGSPGRKDAEGSAAWDDDGVVQRALRHIRKHCPGAYLITDVCLCAYTDHGHCGLLAEDGAVRNEPTLELLARMAVSHAKAGADMVAPSDMMDGRILQIRATLDQHGFEMVPIMSYAAKYASCFYGPFREAAHSAPKAGDRKSYQMDPGNRREALFEMEQDFEEGADILMVKPAMPYLDVLVEARAQFPCPLAAYQVSGEYSMIKAAAANGWIDEKAAVLESLTAIRRAGADLILTYFAAPAARWIRGR